MTVSHHSKVLKQISKKPGKVAKYKKHNKPDDRKFGKSSKRCKRCGRAGGHISSYGLNICRQCFRENAVDLGFKQYN